MQSEHAEHKDEEFMTDLQFLEYKRVRDELEAALKREIDTLRGNQSTSDSNGMTDYQFKKFNELWDERNALRDENKALRQIQHTPDQCEGAG